MFDFRECRLSDAEITRVAPAGDELRVEYRDWQESQRTLVFKNVVGYQGFSPERRELSHGEIETDPEFVSLACQLADEELTTDFAVFTFVDAWAGAKILRVVAKEVTVA